MDLKIADDDWGTLGRLFELFAERRQLAFRDTSETRPGIVRTLYLSVCSNDVTIKTAEQRWATRNYEPQIPGRGVGINVYQVEPDSVWEDLTSDLVAMLEDEWPSQLAFRDGDGRLISNPLEIE